MNHTETELWLRNHATGEAKSETGAVYSYSCFWDKFYKRESIGLHRHEVDRLPLGQYETFRTLPSLPEYAGWRTLGSVLAIDDGLGETRYEVIRNAEGRKHIEHTLHILQALLDEYDGRL